MRPGLAVAAAVVMLALLVPAGASAAKYRGHEVFKNTSHKAAVSWRRAQRLTRRVLHNEFYIEPGSLILACSRHAYRESGCDFAFTDSDSGAYTCGNTVVRASRRSIIARYVAFDAGCGDF